jgi:hypothetical protein
VCLQSTVQQFGAWHNGRSLDERSIANLLISLHQCSARSLCQPSGSFQYPDVVSVVFVRDDAALCRSSSTHILAVCFLWSNSNLMPRNSISGCDVNSMRSRLHSSLACWLSHRIPDHSLPIPHTSASALCSRDHLNFFLFVTGILFRGLPASKASEDPVFLFQCRDFACEWVFLIFSSLNGAPELFVQLAQTALPVLVDLLCLHGLTAGFLQKVCVVLVDRCDVVVLLVDVVTDALGRFGQVSS